MLVLVLIGTATGLLLVLGLVVFLFKWKLGDVQLVVSNSGPSDIAVADVVDTTISISVELVRHAANSFSQGKLLGEGGFSRVFSGEMDGKKVAAVKRFEGMQFGSVAD